MKKTQMNGELFPQSLLPESSKFLIDPGRDTEHRKVTGAGAPFRNARFCEKLTSGDFPLQRKKKKKTFRPWNLLLREKLFFFLPRSLSMCQEHRMEKSAA